MRPLESRRRGERRAATAPDRVAAVVAGDEAALARVCGLTLLERNLRAPGARRTAPGDGRLGEPARARTRGSAPLVAPVAPGAHGAAAGGPRGAVRHDRRAAPAGREAAAPLRARRDRLRHEAVRAAARGRRVHGARGLGAPRAARGADGRRAPLAARPGLRAVPPRAALPGLAAGARHRGRGPARGHRRRRRAAERRRRPGRVRRVPAPDRAPDLVPGSRSRARARRRSGAARHGPEGRPRHPGDRARADRERDRGAGVPDAGHAEPAHHRSRGGRLDGHHALRERTPRPRARRRPRGRSPRRPRRQAGPPEARDLARGRARARLGLRLRALVVDGPGVALPRDRRAAVGAARAAGALPGGGPGRAGQARRDPEARHAHRRRRAEHAAGPSLRRPPERLRLDHGRGLRHRPPGGGIRAAAAVAGRDGGASPGLGARQYRAGSGWRPPPGLPGGKRVRASPASAPAHRDRAAWPAARGRRAPVRARRLAGEPDPPGHRPEAPAARGQPRRALEPRARSDGRRRRLLERDPRGRRSRSARPCRRGGGAVGGGPSRRGLGRVPRSRGVRAALQVHAPAVTAHGGAARPGEPARDPGQSPRGGPPGARAGAAARSRGWTRPTSTPSSRAGSSFRRPSGTATAACAGCWCGRSTR